MRISKTRTITEKNDLGFTILELMIATTIFSTILLVGAAGILRFSHDYFKGINASKTQNSARAIIDEISQNIQFATNVSPLLGDDTPGNAAGYCVDHTLYSFSISRQVSLTAPIAHGLIKTNGTASCSAATPLVPNGSLAAGQREVLGNHMRLGQLKVEQIGERLYRVDVVVIYGDTDLLLDLSTNNAPTGASDWSKVTCSSDSGSQFCAISRLSTTVTRRIGV